MTSKHYRWQLQWSVDLAAGTATHAAGLVFEVGRGPPRVQGGDDAVRDWLATQPALRDPTSQRNRLARLAREAAEVYSDAAQAKASPARRV